MITGAVTALATVWTGVVIHSLLRTSSAAPEMLVVVGRSFTVSQSTKLWLATAGGAGIVGLWLAAAWSFRRRRALRAAAADASRPAARNPILMARVASMQLRVEELQNRLKAVTEERAALRRELRHGVADARLIVVDDLEATNNAHPLERQSQHEPS